MIIVSNATPTINTNIAIVHPIKSNASAARGCFPVNVYRVLYSARCFD